jgi:hypothetical protein
MSSARIVFDPREWAGSPGLHEAAQSKNTMASIRLGLNFMISLLSEMIDPDGERTVAIFAAIVGSGDK